MKKKKQHAMIEMILPGFRGQSKLKLPVLIYEKWRHINAEAEDLGFPMPAKVLGVFLHTTAGFERRGKPIACPGMVLLAKDKLGAGYVAHELSHAVLEIFRKKKWLKGLTKPMKFMQYSKKVKTGPKENEDFCYCMEHYTRAFWSMWGEVPAKYRGKRKWKDL